MVEYLCPKAKMDAHMSHFEYEVVKEKEVTDDEPEGLELGLSLGRWGRSAGSSSNAGREMEGWLSPFDLTVGCSRAYGGDFIPGNEQKVTCYPYINAGAEGAASDLEIGRDCKRPKVLGFPLL